MSVKIESVDFHSGAPAWLTSSYRYLCYCMRGQGFGTGPGVVTMEGDAQRVVKWSPDLIIFAMPNPNPFWNPAHTSVVTVTAAEMLLQVAMISGPFEYLTRFNSTAQISAFLLKR